MDYDYFSNHYKLIVIDLSKQIELENPDLKQKINFIGKLQESDWVTVFFIIVKSEEAKINITKAILLSLIQQVLNQVFAIIVMHLFYMIISFVWLN